VICDFTIINRLIVRPAANHSITCLYMYINCFARVDFFAGGFLNQKKKKIRQPSYRILLISIGVYLFCFLRFTTYNKPHGICARARFLSAPILPIFFPSRWFIYFFSPEINTPLRQYNIIRC